MKRFLLISIAFLVYIPGWLYSQDTTVAGINRNLVLQTAYDYAEGFYSGDAARMESAISQDICKVYPMIYPGTGKTVLIFSTYSGLIELTRSKIGIRPDSARRLSVKVLAIKDDIACVKVLSSGFNDYLNIANINGRWKIVNVLWTTPDAQPGDESKELLIQEKEKITDAIRDYIEGVYTGDLERINRTLNPECRRATIVVLPQTGRKFIDRDGFTGFMQTVSNMKGIPDKNKQDISIEILDSMNGLCFAVLSTAQSVNYIQLAQINSRWQMINILRKRK
ncbi:MAG TPA: nuclear transport factor 2 family protein [Bacteroidales bacterium]|nr:nuclear transport factor 2 family protein [Bacteroidales bacterium]